MKALSELALTIARPAAFLAAAVGLFAASPLALSQDGDDADAAVETVEVAPEAEADADLDAAADDATQLGTLQVTGSRLRRTDFETAQPVLVLTRQDIERTGLTSIGDILQNLPQAGAAINTAFNNGGDGSTEIDLRNLGSNRVLVLVNGRRWVGGVSQLRTGSVDLNTIPLAVIESIEVLKDGASAIYGSDAIAGVINIKTRRDFSGFETRGQYEVLTEGSVDTIPGDGVSYKDDGQIYAVDFSAGTVGRESSAFINVSYTEVSPVFAGSRALSSVPTFGPLGASADGTGHSRGSLFTPGADLLFVPTTNNSTAINNGQPAASDNPDALCYDIVAGSTVSDETGPLPVQPPVGVDLCWMFTLQSPDDPRRGGRGTDPSGRYVPFDFNTDGHNYAPINYLITPQERTSIYGQFSQMLPSDVRFSTEVLYNHRRSQQQLAHTPLAAGDIFSGLPFALAYVDATNPFNPTNPQSPYYIPGTQAQDIGRADPASGLVGFGAVLRRMIESGPRIFTQDVTTVRIGGGLEGQFFAGSQFVGWDAGAVYNETRQTDQNAGIYDMQRVARALGPVDQCVGTDATPAPLDAVGCVPLDLFGPTGSVTQEMLDYVVYTAIDHDRARQFFAYGNMNTEFDQFSDYLAGPLGMAVGAEYRKEFFEGQPDSTKVFATSSTNAESPTSGSYDVQEAYIELGIPLIEGRDYVESLNLSLAGRYSKYGILDNTFDNFAGKLGIEYRPINSLLIRSTVSEAFRAPSITDLFLGEAVSFPEVEDPCNDWDQQDPNSNVYQNCQADGAPPGYSQTNNQIQSVFGGNPDLTPETATTLSAGFVWSPEFIPDFNITVDWYNVEVTEIITFTGTGQVLGLCYNSAPDQRALCEFVQRNPTNFDLQRVDNRTANLGGLEVEGVDVNFDWRLPFAALEPYGSFKWTFDLAYTSKYDQTVNTVDDAGNPQTVTNGFVGIEFGTGAIPRLKFNTALDWELGPWSASWATRYIHEMYEPCDDGRGDPGRAVQPGALANRTPVVSLEQAGLCDGEFSERFDVPTNKVEATFYHDLRIGYDFTQYNTTVSFGMRNVFNTDPPHLTQAFASSYDPTLYEFQNSRTAYVAFQKNF